MPIGHGFDSKNNLDGAGSPCHPIVRFPHSRRALARPTGAV